MGLAPKGQQGGQSSAAAPNNGTSTKAASTYWPVGSDGDISYVYSVRRAWEGGAYVLALVVVVCSGEGSKGRHDRVTTRRESNNKFTHSQDRLA